jgi:hypothetical protein
MNRTRKRHSGSGEYFVSRRDEFRAFQPSLPESSKTGMRIGHMPLEQEERESFSKPFKVAKNRPVVQRSAC